MKKTVSNSSSEKTDFSEDNTENSSNSYLELSPFPEFHMKVLQATPDYFGPSPSSLMDRIKKMIIGKEQDSKLPFLKKLDNFFTKTTPSGFNNSVTKQLGKELAEYLKISPINSTQFVIRRLTSKNQEYYTGFMINSKKEGFGKLYHQNGCIKYEGQFRNNGYNGNCTKLYNKNEKLKYEGGYEQGLRKGFGRQYWDNGKVCYAGDWENNCPIGDEISLYQESGGLGYKGEGLNICINKYFKSINKFIAQ